ncbi:Serine/threonine-protein kinase [Neoconidiobolus thromboides FSU 785]|nr:Serine/threonine-protein kinase [Neoconidiobolus thromboides FSU 785]
MKDMNCNEIQENEIEALKAIYMDDFEIIESNVRSWKVSKKYKEFKIKIKPMDESIRDNVEIYVNIKFPPAYPVIAPEIFLESPKGLSESQYNELKKTIKNKTQELLGSEMVFDLCDLVLEYITNNHVDDKTSSFHQQMIERQEKSIKEEEEKAQKEYERILQLEKEKEEKEKETLSKALEAELFKKEQKLQEERLKRKLIKTEYNLGSLIEFDRPINIYFNSSHSQPLTFLAVTLGPCISKDKYCKTYFALPYNPITNGDTTTPPLLIEEIILFPQTENKIQAIEDLRKIEDTLEKLKNIRHPGILMIYEFKVDDLDLNNISWKLLILQETRLLSSSLKNSLKKCGPLSISLARVYFKELIKAVQVLHLNNINYNYIRTDKIILDCEEETIENSNMESYFDQVYSSVKLISRNYLQYSTNLNEGCFANDSKWAPPESRCETELDSQGDIWDLGIVLVEMLLGPKILDSYTSLTDLLETSFGHFDIHARDLINSMLQIDARDRPKLNKILTHPFLKNETVMVSFSEHLNNPNSSGSNKTQQMMMASSPESNPSNSFQYKSMMEQAQNLTKSISRYENDFEELQFLGRGGFGEVVKARNKLDGRIYAIKKVKLDTKDTENSRKILREVSALSRLHHQYIVRYYTAWLENGNGAWDEDTSEDNSDSEESDSEVSDMDGVEGDFLYTEKSTSFSIKKSMPIRFKRSQSGHTESYDDNSYYDSESNSQSSGLSYRCLYIQMEYCDKNTLRDVIDESISIDECWRILRQILEGLDHLHSQGMIHRDLKPSNLFLAANGDVKIGDFGLATSSNSMSEGVGSRRISYEIYNGSMTSEVGTSFYMSPEVVSKTARYNQKVDMYSLGIIFFEMIYPFSTGMERAMILRDLRLPTILFPQNFPSNLKVQAKIIQSLLNHNEKERPTALELLQSNLLPTRIEDEYIQECIRTIANPTTPHYGKLMNTLFSQPIDRHKDLVYDHKTKNSGELPAAVYSEFIRSLLTVVFKRHGAVEFIAPLLIPKSEKFSEFQKPAYLLDPSGNIVQMPYDLTLPFVRFMSRSNILALKRFTFDRVYRQNMEDDSLIEVQEADFDIITTNKEDIVSESEVMKIVDEIMDSLPISMVTDCYFQINHGLLATIIMDACKVPKQKRANVAVILSQLEAPKTLLQVRSLLSRCHLSKAMVEELLLLYATGDLDLCHNKLRKMSLLKGYKATIDKLFEHLKKVVYYCKKLGINRKIIFNSFNMYNLQYYESGIMFRMIRDGKKGDILAVGGRYDSLLSRYRSPLASTIPLKYGVGVSIALQKLTLLLSQYETQKNNSKKGDEDRNTNIWIPKILDVYITSFGKGLYEERLDIARELWNHQIRCDYRREEEAEFNLDLYLQNNKILGVNWIVFVKSTKKDEHSVKVRNINLKSEVEVPLAELANYLANEIAENHRLDLQAAGITTRRKMEFGNKYLLDDEGLSSGLSDLNINSSSSCMIDEDILPTFNLNLINTAPNKVNPKRKRQLFDRALEAVLKIGKNAFKSGTPVLVMELSREGLRKILECSLQDEDSFKKMLNTLPSNQRAQVQLARSTLLSYNTCVDNDTYSMAWLYSIKDDCALCYQFK